MRSINVCAACEFPTGSAEEAPEIERVCSSFSEAIAILDRASQPMDAEKPKGLWILPFTIDLIHHSERITENHDCFVCVFFKYIILWLDIYLSYLIYSSRS
jgi:hypothetical protein